MKTNIFLLIAFIFATFTMLAAASPSFDEKAVEVKPAEVGRFLDDDGMNDEDDQDSEGEEEGEEEAEADSDKDDDGSSAEHVFAGFAVLATSIMVTVF